MEKQERAMEQAIERARETMRKGIGGPFGAAIMDSNGEVIAVASNTVLGDHDPTAHAEVNAIRTACKFLGTHDLSGCTLFATSEPCPMCLSAIIWANIKNVYYGCSAGDAADIGFRDDFIYHFIHDLVNGSNKNSTLELKRLSGEKCLELFEEYKRENRQMY